MEQKFAPPESFAKISGLSRSTIYNLLAAGSLTARKVGKRTLIDVDHGLAWINSQPPLQIRGRQGYRAEGAS